ncbi:MAG: hypothetical protein NZ700_05165 [Gemmataceae bacterium]|nr:hypothetical protein [Gemmataceae bacterium]MDW8264635.1 hypothetical protein [Gemmataceae bacterium]
MLGPEYQLPLSSEEAGKLGLSQKVKEQIISMQQMLRDWWWPRERDDK